VQVSATLSILVTWIDGCEPEAPPLDALEPVLAPEALEPVVLAPEEDGLVDEDGLLDDVGLLEEALLPPLAFVTVPATATSWPMCEFNFEVSAPEGMIR
jgi:hypothetical protein